MGERPKNHLGNERSLYLRQHARNPVDWYPWGQEALAAAKDLDRPLFISIGYSACHWCHVMARESFEDEYVGSVLNRDYVSIKVDREERPDLDGIYMSACQMISGGGGWPLTIIATPEGKPFFAGTYFAKGGSVGSPGIVDVLQDIATRWKLARGEVTKVAEEVAKALQEFASYREPAELSPDILAVGRRQAESSFDEVNGGFEVVPKFPTPHRLSYLLRYHQMTGDGMARDMVMLTLRRMREGGLFDHVGYGFHRYSTDARWLLPHFEKMLYDQALLAMAYAEAFAASGDMALKRTSMLTFAYVERDMTSPYGAFYSAESAESEGEEGKYYVWRSSEIEEQLGEGARMFMEAFDVKREGNYRDEASRRRTGANVLHRALSAEELGRSYGTTPEAAEAALERGLSRLFEARERRTRPERDDKVLTDWNGLMVASMARCSALLGERRLLDQARRAADFLLFEMCRGGRLSHRFVDGQVGIDGFLDDYSFAVWGMVEMHKAGGGERYLQAAEGLAQAMIAHFWNPDAGGFYFTADDAEVMIARRMDGYDGAMPSGNSVAASSLAELSRITGEGEYERRARATIKAFAADLSSNPLAHAHMLMALMALDGVSVHD